MHEDTIVFELPTHFLPKIALRLECLYHTINQACEEMHPVIHHYALKSLIEILSIIEKPELKSRFLKELMRIEHSITKSGVTLSPRLHKRLQIEIQILTHVVGRFGDSIHTSPFLQSIKYSQQTQLYDCEMHSPQLLLWLESAPALRQSDLAKWLEYLKPLQATVDLYLSLLRSTAEFHEIEMHNGFYQLSLPSKNNCPLILLRMQKSFGVVPRIQLGHHSLSFRLYGADTMREVRETKAKFDLAFCKLG
jgi:cell division protein ZapD